MNQFAPSADDDIPAGFVRMRPYGEFHELAGPFYAMQRADRTVVGMRVARKHLNGGGILHGGMCFMLLDTAMTRACLQLRRPESFPVTTSFSSELIAPVRPDDWIEAEVRILRAGARMVFLSCLVRRDGPEGEIVARGSGTFQMQTLSRPSSGG